MIGESVIEACMFAYCRVMMGTRISTDTFQFDLNVMASGPGTSSTYAITTIKILVAQPITRMAGLLSVWDAHPSMREEVARRLLASSGATRERRGCLVINGDNDFARME
ncbi:hypothetical protein PGTUg99_006472 [Puccinia graminis f. sp. tritici]|uniref:Uncharacterized protein n=1 Tax=Puccinia graminis f. sp. tritici TaxID=56615 RepID=A0A5B0PRA4_PUCGR|nr:hypothetical protein PGTUg99_006472 [Puccinia graminis f. sp. tritici]